MIEVCGVATSMGLLDVDGSSGARSSCLAFFFPSLASLALSALKTLLSRFRRYCIQC